MGAAIDLREFIRDVPDFPKPGILFRDITPLLHSAEAFADSIQRLAEPYREMSITRIAAVESRGFIFGGAMAQLLGCGFIPIRKPAKLPWRTFRHEYELEYGSDALEVHHDALSADDRVLIVDDVLATGGTAAAAAALVAMCGAQAVGLAILIELKFLGGRQRLEGIPVHALVEYA